MRKIFYIIFVIFLSSTFAQKKISFAHSNQNLDCSSCHICKTPTKNKPCLSECPRSNKKIKSFKIKNAPKVFEINNVHGEKDLYGPVKFSHKAHAEMAEMKNGCATCHHNTVNGKIEKCSTCHTNDRIKSTPNMPDLKSAYHRECMSCHQTWEEESKCENCHTVNPQYRSDKTKPEIVTVHKKVIRPDVHVFETSKCTRGDKVTFHHNEHIELFGLQCVDCHKDESCAVCHNQNPNFKEKENIFAHHSRCNSCHNTEDKKECATCHSNKETKGFNHFAKTGFDINIYHSKVSCNSCHTKSGTYKGLNSQCQSCHTWDTDNFDHSITGLKLDDNHIDNDCSDCHEDDEGNLNYKKPTCTNCHDEDEGFVVPNKLPGKKVKR